MLKSQQIRCIIWHLSQIIKMKNNKQKMQARIWILLLLSLFLIGAMSQATSLTENTPPALTPLQQKLITLIGGNNPNSAMLMQSPQVAGLLQLLSQFPEALIESFLTQLGTGLLDPTSQGFNIANNFSNWAQTVNTSYSRILYPSDYSPQSGLQIAQIQNFVKQVAFQGKRVRGAGNRHSWSNIFADPDQFLVSFNPYQVAEGISQAIEGFSEQMIQLDEGLSLQNIEHIFQIRKVGEFNETTSKNGGSSLVRKRLVKIGAGVSMNQLRLWCKKNGLQYQVSTLTSEVTFVGALMTCSHGSGSNVRLMNDLLHEIQFIDHKGKRQILSRSQHSKVFDSASCSLGLLGPVIFVTIEMEDIQIVQMKPRLTYKDFVIPWPKDYPRKQERLQRDEWKQYVATVKPTAEEQDWQKNLDKFKQTFEQTYAEWFYSPIQGVNVFEAVWNVYAAKNADNIGKIGKEGLGLYMEEYPPQEAIGMSLFSMFLTGQLANNIQTQSVINVLQKTPYALFPQANTFINYPDALHYLRGIHNQKVRSFQVTINIPAVNNKGVIEPDYDLIQKIWWATIEISQKRSDSVNMVVEMRFFKGSRATLAPNRDYDYTCSIEITRSLALTDAQQEQWVESVDQVYAAWKNIRDSQGKAVVLRPHWGKQWDVYLKVKADVLSDEGLKANFKTFLNDYKLIAKEKGFDPVKNLQTFSNKLYRELLNNAIGPNGAKIN